MLASLLSSPTGQRRRGPLTVAQKAAAEPLLALPATTFPAELQVERVVSAIAPVFFEANREGFLYWDGSRTPGAA